MLTVVVPEELRTGRLRLRRWRDADLEPFAALNADPVVMEHFPAPLTREQSDAMVARIEETFGREEYGLWAVEVGATGAFAGFVGLWPATFNASFTPAVEIGYRLAREHWGEGYASEAARAALADGFERLGRAEIVSFTAVVNVPSQRVMEKLGMTHDPDDDFDHPALPPGHRLRRHALYSLARPSGPMARTFDAGEEMPSA
ncbi:GNAT family N-acetyltransferase [Iamia sp.]|uniref:GNAT family N-acetyltransferase n=1 Tax=Iamia sp. TaxID=2722710 RepID=UPI002C573F1B|nr:GNAT family N-acetyltransferase [Iamia sp.]HXH58702.1 GNAT family N-acetyltransferase [Iamia sp.]